MSRLHSFWFHAWRFVVLIVVVSSLTGTGLWIRDLCWGENLGLPFRGDISNGFRWGRQANQLGYFGLYEQLGEPEEQGAIYQLDYAPLRLGMMSLWVNGLPDRYPDVPSHQRLLTRDFHRPLLLFNTSMELLTAFAAGILTYHLIRWRLVVTSVWSGVWQAVLASVVTWFNPVIICNAHFWPQWDIWPMPFFLFAIYLSLKKYWLPAGFLLGVGALLKGQMLMVAWIFPVWALIIGDWRGAIRVAVGLLLGITLVGLPWEISTHNPNAVRSAFDLASRNFSLQGIAHLIYTTALAIIVPFLFRKKLARWKSLYPSLILLVFSIGLIYSMHIGGSDLWLKYSFAVGMRHHQRMYLGEPSNLASLLVANYGWYIGNIDEVFAPLPQSLGGELSIRNLLLLIFFSLSFVCTLFAGINHRRRDPRMIIALILPWILFYSIALQIHERYLLYGSACCAILLAAGRGWFLLGLVFTFLGFLPTIDTLFRVNGYPTGGYWMKPFDPWSFIAMFTSNSFPGIAWMLLTGCCVMLYGIIPRSIHRSPSLDSSLIESP